MAVLALHPRWGLDRRIRGLLRIPKGDVHRWVAASKHGSVAGPFKQRAAAPAKSKTLVEARGFAMEWSLTVLKDEV